MKKILLPLTLAILSLNPVMAQVAPAPAVPADFDPFKETKAEYDARAQWLRDAKVGVFIHWNPSSLIGKEISWSRGGYGKEKYDQLYKQFKAERFNADQWVKLFYDSGIRYAVIVPKHHDGFCMFNTKTSGYNVMNTPFGRDYVKEMAEACGRGGVRFCLYYSILDWWNPKYNAHTKDLSVYKNEVFKPHMQELMTQYGPVGYIWFDGDWEPSWTHASGREMYDFIRRLRPATLIGNRIESIHGTPVELGQFCKEPDAVGDFAARELWIGPYDSEKAWDSCYNLSPNGWSWTPPMPLRPLKDIVGFLIQCIGRDGAMLLGVGPRPDGLIDPPQSEEMLKLGAWLKANGEAVYGTRGGPYLPGAWGASTRKGDKIYLFVSRWKNGALKLPRLSAEIKAARLISSGTVSVQKEGGTIVVRVPEASQAPIATVVELTMDRNIMKLPVMETPVTINLALGKPVKASSIGGAPEKQPLALRRVTDGEPCYGWGAESKAREAWVMVDLEKECEVREAMLSDAPHGRTQEFDLEAQIGGEWKKIAAGTTIGSERWLEFDPVKARFFRLNIRKASKTPTLAEFQLF